MTLKALKGIERHIVVVLIGDNARKKIMNLLRSQGILIRRRRRLLGLRVRRGRQSKRHEGHTGYDCNGTSELEQAFQGSFVLGDFRTRFRGTILSTRLLAFRIVAAFPFRSECSGQPVARTLSPSVKLLSSGELLRPRERLYLLDAATAQIRTRFSSSRRNAT